MPRPQVVGVGGVGRRVKPRKMGDFQGPTVNLPEGKGFKNSPVFSYGSLSGTQLGYSWISIILCEIGDDPPNRDELRVLG